MLALVIVAGGRDAHFPLLASECRRRSPRFSARTTRAAEISRSFATWARDRGLGPVGCARSRSTARSSWVKSARQLASRRTLARRLRSRRCARWAGVSLGGALFAGLPAPARGVARGAKLPDGEVVWVGAGVAAGRWIGLVGRGAGADGRGVATPPAFPAPSWTLVTGPDGDGRVTDGKLGVGTDGTSMFGGPGPTPNRPRQGRGPRHRPVRSLALHRW